MNMQVYEHPLYKEDIEYVADLDLPWEKFQDKSILISGATGMIGSFLVDVLMRKNSSGLNCKVYAVGRNEDRAKEWFEYCWESNLFEFIRHDINYPLDDVIVSNKIGYVLHLASNTHPIAYSSDPIGTITTNIIGLKNMLDFAVEKQAIRFLFASSNEIYGENRGDVELFKEDYCGYIDCNTMRAGYPESKRCGEALCQAYKSQKDLDVVIPRLTRTFGPTLLDTDTKALSQFIHKGIKGEDIVLKSEGNQYYSYTYVADAVSGLLYVLLKGERGEAYNIAYKAGDVRLRDLAKIVADECGTKVVFDMPEENERKGYSAVTKARLDGGKLKELGWKTNYDITEGIKKTVSIMNLENTI